MTVINDETTVTHNASNQEIPRIADSDMKLLKVISLLIDYPTNELFEDDNLTICKQLVSTSSLISPKVRNQIKTLIDDLIEMGPLEAQANYDGLFERGRSLSLWLFEHVHGESRDRGQAMVDLMDQYERAGFEIGLKELPDYLPMYLEYLAHKAAVTGDEIEIRMDIADVSHILALLAARLKDRNSTYLGCFNALLQIAGKPLEAIAEFEAKVKKEQRDDTFDAMDKEWEEEVVDFLGAEQQERCPSSMQNQSNGIAIDKSVNPPKQVDAPVHWVDFNQATKKSIKQPKMTKQS